MFEWLGYYMSMRKIRLDEPGSTAWRLLDGSRSVHEVVREMRREFGEAVEPAEERVGRLIQLFHQEDFISYPGWEAMESDAPG